MYANLICAYYIFNEQKCDKISYMTFFTRNYLHEIVLH